MKNLIFIFFLLFPAYLFGQCKYEENKTDEFTKEKIVKLKKQRIFSKVSWSTNHIDAKLMRIDSVKFLYIILTHVTTGSSYSCFSKNDILYLKLQNDTIVQLKNLNIDCGNYQSTPRGYYYILSFWLTEDIITLLRSSPMIKLRLGIVEGDIKGSDQTYFIDNINCLY